MKALTMILATMAAMVMMPIVLMADDTEQLPHAFEAGWKGEKTCELLYETPEVRVAKCTFPPGVGHEKHYHNPHLGYVLEGGTMLITDASGERRVKVETGSSFSTTERTVHQGVNVGGTTTSYLMIEPRSGGKPTP